MACDGATPSRVVDDESHPDDGTGASGLTQQVIARLAPPSRTKQGVPLGAPLGMKNGNAAFPLDPRDAGTWLERWTSRPHRWFAGRQLGWRWLVVDADQLTATACRRHESGRLDDGTGASGLTQQVIARLAPPSRTKQGVPLGAPLGMKNGNAAFPLGP